MKLKFITLLLAFISMLSIQAKYEIQVVPFQTRPGLTTDDAQCFQINLNNDVDVWGLQLDFKLPEGMTLDADAVVMNNDLKRFPAPRRGNPYHTVQYNTLEDGWTRVLITNTATYGITGTTGVILDVYYLTDANLKPGLYPIKMRTIKIALNINTGNDEDRKVILDEATSYFYVGESPMKSQKDADLSCLSNYVPSFVMDAVNNDLAQNQQLRSLNLCNADDLGAEPVFNNPNTLCYINANSKIATKFDESKKANIVKKDVDKYTCTQLTLDESYPFYCGQQVNVNNASLLRSPVSAQWNTLCLPFDLSKEQIEAAYGTGAYVQNFVKFENNVLYFMTSENGYVNNTPNLLFVPEAKTANQYDFGAVVMQPTSETPNVTFGGASFNGNYAGKISATGLYGVTADSKIMHGGSQATVKGFKALFDIAPTINAKLLSINHGETTGIDIETIDGTANGNVYSIDGKLVQKSINEKIARETLPKGIYIINKKKVIVK